MSEKKRLPSWVKIVVILVLLSIVFTILEAVSRYLIPIVFYLALIMFPGPDRENPRLLRWSPYLWGLSFFAAAAFLIAGMMGKSLVSVDADVPSNVELWQTILFVPPLIWTLLKRQNAFRYLLIVTTVISLAWGVYEYTDSVRDGKAFFQMSGDAVGELLLTIYLLKKFKPGQISESQHPS